jgi:hypothetical protein
MIKIETSIRIDRRTAFPYWSARLIYSDGTERKVLLEVVSQTFRINDWRGASENLERVNVRLLKEIESRKDRDQLMMMLIKTHAAVN